MASGAVAQLPLGSEFQVNVHTIGTQGAQSVAADADGDFVVVWASYHDGSSSGVFGRRFSKTGDALATEFQVNTYTLDTQGIPSVAADTDGDFVVAWASYLEDASGGAIFARRFASTGVALAIDFQVNTYTFNRQSSPSAAVDADDDFVVVWPSVDQDDSKYGVFGRRFSNTGVALSSEFQVNSYTQDDQYQPWVALDADGDFVVVWQSLDQDDSSYGVFARRFSSDGAALASEFQIDSYTMGGAGAAVATDTDGDLVIVWESLLDGGTGIFGRRFSSAGIAQASEFQVSSYTTGLQGFSSVAVDSDGDFVVAWRGPSQEDDLGILARASPALAQLWRTSF